MAHPLASCVLLAKLFIMTVDRTVAMSLHDLLHPHNDRSILEIRKPGAESLRNLPRIIQFSKWLSQGMNPGGLAACTYAKFNLSGSLFCSVLLTVTSIQEPSKCLLNKRVQMIDDNTSIGLDSLSSCWTLARAGSGSSRDRCEATGT